MSLDALFSIKPKYIDKIFDLEKSVEIRNRTVNLESGTTIWLYATSPRMQLEGKATIKNIDIGSINYIWEKYGKFTGLGNLEYLKYVDKSKTISALELVDIVKFRLPKHLYEIRKASKKFQPPQFYLNISNNVNLNPLADYLSKLNSKEHSCV